MADNSSLPVASGNETFANEDIAGVKFPTPKLAWGPNGTANRVDTASGKALPVQIRGSAGGDLVKLEDGASANADPGVPILAVRKAAAANTSDTDSDYEFLQIFGGRLYVRGEPRAFAVAAVSAVTRPNNTTAYSANDAVSNSATAASVTPISFSLSDTNDDPITLERMRILSTDTGLAGNMLRAYLYQSDPTASTGVVGGDNAAFSTKQGTFIGTMSGTLRGFSDGSGGVLVPDEGSRIVVNPTSGAKTIFALLMTPTGFTPSANSTTITPTLEGFQARA